MKKIVVTLLVLVLVVFSFQILQEDEKSIKIHNDQLSKTFLSRHIPIIDIRTKKEWEQTGVVKDSILLTFYDEEGKFNEESFLRSLNTIADKADEFAILCRSGNRSNRVSRFLISKGYKNVINLAGGIKQGVKNNIKLEQFH